MKICYKCLLMTVYDALYGEPKIRLVGHPIIENGTDDECEFPDHGEKV